MLIRGVAPDKPVRYVIATHFHHDHVAGLHPYIKMGATVPTTPEARDVVARTASVPHALHPNTYAVAPAAVRTEAVVGSRVIADAHHRLELHDIAANPHAAQMLVAYSPAHRLLFEPDLLDGSLGDPVDAGPYTVALARGIEQRRLDVETIVPVHGPPVTRAYLNLSLAVRRKHVPG